MKRAALVALLLAACSRPAPPPPPAAPPAAPPASSPEQDLAKLDSRTPVPLLPMMANHQKQNMRDHLLAVQEIIAGLSAEDFAAVETAATRIASSPETSQMCDHMGAAAPGFAELGKSFHATADGILAAARAHDRAAVTSALGATLAKCTSCHQTYRQQIVSSL